MRRFPWDILFTLLLGLGLGLAYAWLIAPLRVTDSTPDALRADFKDYYRSAIAASYTANRNLPRAEARLAVLGDENLLEALNSQAQRLNASGEFAEADRIVELAVALEIGTSLLPVPTTTTEPFSAAPNPTDTLPPATDELSFILTETPVGIPPTAETPLQATEPASSNPTPRPTRTAIPTIGVPFALIAQDEVCDATLPDGLLQVMVFSASRRQVAGARIIINWENGEEQFFTGLKPELGNGYGDFNMSPEVIYTVRLAAGSEIAVGLIAPTCQTASGESFLGGIKLTFQQP